MTEQQLDNLLSLVRRPGRYCGNEINVVRKDWEGADLHLALAFPDLYEIGMSHQGLQILYQILNSRENVLAERVYAPDTDLEALLREQGMPLFSLESKRSLAKFDILAVTLPYELCYTNILTIFDLAGIPFRAEDRDSGHPLVIGGGSCSCHSEPVADFFDLIFLGDGEEAVLEIADTVIDAGKAGRSREGLLLALAGIEGVYVPEFYRPRYDQKGHFQGMDFLRKEVGPVRRRVLSDLDVCPPAPPLVPLTGIIHDRLGLEVARGCTRGCRFCQAGMTYRPVRERDPELITRLARQGIDESGFEELALLSLSSGDYSCLTPLLRELMVAFAAERVSVSLPSMRAGTLTSEIMELIRKVRKTGFTIAPEAGSERLRQVINKGITEEDILETCRSAASLGWKLIKFYFMFGLPTETREDLEAIPALAHKALAAAGRKSGLRVTVSAGTFVPKPHTPFQWEPQLSLEESFERVNYLKQAFPLPRKGRPGRIQLRWADPGMSFLEGVMSRGDRKLGALIEKAWKMGARLDGWSDHYSLDLWQEAARETGITLESYLRQRSLSEPLPWDHLETGVDQLYLKEEYARSRRRDYTPDCRYNGCQQCGLCDFKTIRPRIRGEWIPVPAENQEQSPESGQYYYSFLYQRLGTARFLSHLELMTVFFRAFRRIRLPLAFSQGFNPSPRVSFSPALPLGTESLAEHLYVELTADLSSPEKSREQINNELPEGLTVTEINRTKDRKTPAGLITTYQVDLAGKEVDPGVFAGVLARERHYVTVLRKKKERRIDLREQLVDIGLEENGRMRLVLASESGKAGLKPIEILTDLLGLKEEEQQKARVMKTEVKVQEPPPQTPEQLTQNTELSYGH